MGPVRLDIDDKQLLRDGMLHPIQPAIFDALLTLSKHRHRLLPREELHELLFPGVFVSESALSQVVRRIRAALGPHSQWLQTLPRRGYRFDPPRDDKPQPWPGNSEEAAFVGRERTLDLLEDVVSRAGHVTVLGTGGIGKTRLVREFCDRRASGVPTIWVDAAELFHEHALSDAIWDAAGGRQVRPGRPLDAATLHTALRGGLLVLDNLEHLAGAFTSIGTALAALDAAVVCTSRCRLGYPTERILDLTPLEPQEAERLLRDQIERVRLGLGDDVASWIPELAARVDHVPLALIVTAPRLLTHAPPQVLESLVHGADGPVCDAARAAWTGLGAIDRRVAIACALFATEFSLDHAEAVVGSSIGNAPVSLLDSALLIRTAPGSFRMLSALGRAILAIAPDVHTAELEARHRAWVLDGGAPPQVLGPNLWAAYARQPSVDLALAIHGHEDRRGVNPGSVRVALDEALELTTEPSSREDLLLARSVWHARQGDGMAALADIEAVEASGGLGSEVGRLTAKGQVLAAAGRVAEAQELFQRAVHSGDPACPGPAQIDLAVCALRRGEPDVALTLARGVWKARGARDSVLAIRAASVCAEASFQLNDVAQSLVFADRALELARAEHNPLFEALALQRLGVAMASAGRLERGRHHLHAALEVCRHAGPTRREVLKSLVELELTAGEVERASAILDEVARYVSDSPVSRAELEEHRGELALLRGDAGAACAHFDHAVALRRQSDSQAQLCDALLWAAWARALASDVAGAQTRIEEAMPSCTDDAWAMCLLGGAKALLELEEAKLSGEASRVEQAVRAARQLVQEPVPPALSILPRLLESEGVLQRG